jgi:aryl-alcohol dehydrogenase-like predicted oxidoreductase
LKKKFGAGTADLSRVALQYILSYDITGCVIPGFRNKAQVEINLKGADMPLTEGEISFIRDVFSK